MIEILLILFMINIIATWIFIIYRDVSFGKEIEKLKEKTKPKELSQEQEDFKKDCENKLTKIVEKVVDNYNSKITQLKKDFEDKLSKSFKEACDKIDFTTVNYKKTITKKRREFARKNKALHPEEEYRSIDDE